ncbi:MAG TPA: SDR family NAD(P)-dependent oxidoreductase [Pirellulales bacterium]
MQSNPFNLAGRRVLVTGASSGIGRATSILLAQLGAELVCLGRNEARLAETLAALAPGKHVSQTLELSDSDSIAPLLTRLAAEGGPFAGVVHSAGVQRAAPLRIVKSKDFVDQFNINVLSAAMLTAAIAKRGVAAPTGCSVVLIGSVMSLLGAAGLSAYCASKGALVGMTRAAALELAPARIRVNALLPGVVDTEMSRAYLEQLGEEHTQTVTRMHPLGLGSPADVAGAVAFLLSDAARWITGSCLTIDGGYSAH